MKIVNKIGLSLLVLIGLLLIIGFFLPAKIHVERSIVINGPSEVIFNQINTLKNWEKWSPWQGIDPAIKITYTGPESGPGASYKWESKHPDVGDGVLTIISSIPGDTICTTMDFMEQGKAFGGYKFVKTEGGVKLTWSMLMDMGMNPVGRYFGLVMDKMVGPDFEKGLKNIKAISENSNSTGVQQ
jgi:hypothetical protein